MVDLTLFMKIHTIDLHFQEREHAIAVFLLEGPDGCILIETGPESTREVSIRGIEEAGFSIEDIKGVFVTHIHLDHAGAAGWWASEKGIPVYAHPKAVRHLIDPTRLVESARMVYGDSFDSLWGEMIPAPEDLVHIIGDGETVTIAGIEVTAMDTPGHAFHHHCFVIGDIAFTGDAGGVRLPEHDFVSVASAPPQFHLEYLLETLAKLRARKFSSIYMTHFGEVDDPEAHFLDYVRAVSLNAKFVQDRLREGMDADSLHVAYLAFQMEQAFRHELPSEIWESIRISNPPAMCADGIRLYWEKQMAQDAE